VIVTLIVAMARRTLSPLVVGKERTGTPVAPVAPSVRMNKRENPDVMESSIGGNPVISIGTASNKLLTLNGEQEIRIAGSSPEGMASRGVLDTKEVGSARTAIRMVPKLKRKKPRYGTEIGAEIDTVLTVIGPAVLNLNRNLNGWMPMTGMSPEGCTPRKISSAGKKG
jgi:hypothetical protein